MVKIVLFAVALAICVGAYYFFYAGEEGLLGGAESYEQAQERFSEIRPADTVWTPEMNQNRSSGQSN